METSSSKKIISDKELWWFLLNNKRGESNCGLMYAKSLSNKYKNEIIQIRDSNPIAEQFSGFNLLLKFIEKKATCIYVHGRANIIFLIISKFLGFKSVLMVHDYMRYNNKDKKFINKIKSFYHKFIHDISLNLCNKFIFNSQTTFTKSPYSKKIQNKFDKNYEIINPLPSYPPVKIKEDKSFTIKETIDIIIITGHTNNKNYNFTLEILEQVSKFNKKNDQSIFTFHVFGLNTKKISFDSYKNKAFNFYRIDSSIKDLINIHQKCEFFVSLSNDEGFGIPLLDSILLGSFPIVSNIESYNEILNKNKIYIKKYLLIDLFDSKTIISKKIYSFIKNQINEARSNKKKMIINYSKIYKKIISETQDKLFKIVE